MVIDKVLSKIRLHNTGIIYSIKININFYKMLMDTIKIENKKNTLLIAHRGASHLETENSYPAFVAAGNRSYYGIECDVHKTLDGKFVIIHDDFTGRVAIDNMEVEKTTYNCLRNLTLLDIDGKKGRNDIRIPSLKEYFEICKKYNKVAVLEFKNRFEKEEICQMVEIIKDLDYFEKTIFISFCLENLINLKNNYPTANSQYLIEKDLNDELIKILIKNKLDLDCLFSLLTKDNIKKLHDNNVKVNCWTVDDKEIALKLIDWGIDFITSNVLE